NGFSHQDPGFIDHVVNKKAEVIRVYLPPDANTLLACTDHCLRSRGYVNVIVAGKHPEPQWLTMDQAIQHCAAGISVLDSASSDRGGEAGGRIGMLGDRAAVGAAGGGHPLAPPSAEPKVRLPHRNRLMASAAAERPPAGPDDPAFDALFPPDKPTVFAFHG